MRETACGHRLVLKPLFGSQGKGLRLLGRGDELPAGRRVRRRLLPAALRGEPQRRGLRLPGVRDRGRGGRRHGAARNRLGAQRGAGSALRSHRARAGAGAAGRARRRRDRHGLRRGRPHARPRRRAGGHRDQRHPGLARAAVGDGHRHREPAGAGSDAQNTRSTPAGPRKAAAPESEDRMPGPAVRP